jgi:hypothetical protein
MIDNMNCDILHEILFEDIPRGAKGNILVPDGFPDERLRDLSHSFGTVSIERRLLTLSDLGFSIEDKPMSCTGDFREIPSNDCFESSEQVAAPSCGKESASQATQKMKRDRGEVSIAFVDAMTSTEQLLDDFEKCWEFLCGSGCLIVLNYGEELPATKEVIDRMIELNYPEVTSVHRFRQEKMVFLRKSPIGLGASFNPRIAVLFCHHARDPMTLLHLDLLRSSNRGDSLMDIIPCGFPESELVDEAIALSPDWRLPKNNSGFYNDRWSEIDLIIYQFVISGRISNYDSVIFIESDCRVSAGLRNIYRRDISAACSGSYVRLGARDTIGWVHWDRLPEWKKLIIGENVAAITPINGFIASSNVLRNVVRGLLRSPRIFGNMFCEVRLGTACRMFGHDPSSALWMAEVNEWYVSDKRNNQFGLLHPVK